ncbi:guanine nucleotide binding protein, alpha subunit [Hyaloscypha finlandica]|nr:guanine nucleotide binding protein, alpha subunit [Hyaloscypha finlandica]
MRIIYQTGFSGAELLDYRSTIFRNVVRSAKGVVGAMKQFGIVPAIPANRKYVDFITEYTLDPDLALPLDQEFGDALSAVWSDACIEGLMERQAEFYLMDSAIYFFEGIRRISSANYLPDETDILLAKINPSGISETRFQMGRLSIKMVDINCQRSERKKWIKAFENVPAILFVVDMDEYDEVFFEESNRNRMMESMVLFDSVVNSRWFMRSSVFLLLNNLDSFRRKLRRAPLANYFPDYSGGNDVNKAEAFILSRFTQLNRAHLNIYPHLIETIDKSKIQQVFESIEETIIKSNIVVVAVLAIPSL